MKDKCFETLGEKAKIQLYLANKQKDEITVAKYQKPHGRGTS